jgi:hypothetical protein
MEKLEKLSKIDGKVGKVKIWKSKKIKIKT